MFPLVPNHPGVEWDIQPLYSRTHFPLGVVASSRIQSGFKRIPKLTRLNMELGEGGEGLN